jgi:hypothetical protein
LTAPRGQLRAAYRLTAGMSRTNLARAENVAPAEIDQLLAQPDFQELLEALTEMQALPPEERLRQLEQMAWCVLEMAVGTGDWRAAAFVADQMRRGCHPARSLAQAVLDAQARALAQNPGKPVRPRRARPYDAVDAALGRQAPPPQPADRPPARRHRHPPAGPRRRRAAPPAPHLGARTLSGGLGQAKATGTRTVQARDGTPRALTRTSM